MKARLSVRLIGLFLLFGLGPLLVTSIMINSQAGEALRRASFEKMVAATHLQSDQIELYFHERRNEVTALSINRVLTHSFDTFHELFHQFVKAGKKVGSQEWVAALDPGMATWLEKRIALSGYHDLLLIDEDGNVVYSVAREADLGENVQVGNLKESPLGMVFAKAKQGPAIQDFLPYAPSKGEFAAFIGAPVLKESRVVGVVVLQLPTEPVDKMLRERTGLGESEEIYLVGRLNGVTSYRSNRSSKEGRIGHKRTDEWIEKALNGESGQAIKSGSTGKKELICYTPLELPGLNWAIIGTRDADEAFAEVDRLHRFVWMLGVVLAVVVAIVGWLFARSISRPLSGAVNVITSSATQIAASINEQERVAAQQAASVNQTNTTMDELGASARQSAEQADSAANGARQALELAQQGMERVEETLLSIEGAKERVSAIAQQILRLSEQTGQIRDITGLVSDFANETKMLAMNAAVEAVRAGEHGKGFSVLAVETRKLADESKRSAGRINGLVGEIQKATNATVMATEEGSKTMEQGILVARRTSEAFQSVAESISSAAESSQQISMNVRQQAVAIRQVVDAMQTINIGAKENASGIAQIKTGIGTLNDAAKMLKDLV
ncbi:MAG: methyl-accepting chemotaxis protein [Magnetococcales bacterium]|nr:methyl-accepting chemotaxis protein [Magnetococcales bacterium]